MDEAQRRVGAAAHGRGDQRGALPALPRYARERGVNRLLYCLARLILRPAFLIWFRLVAHRPRARAGSAAGLIVASNHRSFLDPFVIGALLPWRRPMQYVAKVELFEQRWQGWLLSRLGAFPIRRGQSDETAMETARVVARARRHGRASSPRGRGSGRARWGRRSAASAAWRSRPAPRCCRSPCTGSEHVRRGWRIRPRKVRLRVGRPMTFPRTEHPSPALAATVTDRIWPNIELQWEWLGGLPPLRKAAVIGAGSWGTAIAVLLARGGLEVQLGTRSRREGGGDRRASARTRATCPGVTLPEAVTVKRAGRHRARRRATSSASPCRPRRCPPPSARSATGSARAPRCCC